VRPGGYKPCRSKGPKSRLPGCWPFPERGRLSDLLGVRQEHADLEEVVVTGAYGFSLVPAALKRVAMRPANMVDKLRFVPGGALEGVSRLLRDPQGPARVQALADSLQAYPLSGTPAFEKAYLHALDF